MVGHVSEEALLDLVEGTAAPDVRAHALSCEACRARAAQAAEALTLAAESGIPEPSPLYWEAFGRKVGRRIAAEHRPSRRPLWLLPTLAAAALVVAVSIRQTPRPVATPSPLALPAWSALPPADEDEGLAVLEAVASANADVVTGFERAGLQEMVFDLSDDDSQALAERLRADADKGGAL